MCLLWGTVFYGRFPEISWLHFSQHLLYRLVLFLSFLWKVVPSRMGLTFIGSQCRPRQQIPLQNPVCIRDRRNSWMQFKCQFKEFIAWQGEILPSVLELLQCWVGAYDNFFGVATEKYSSMSPILRCAWACRVWRPFVIAPNFTHTLCRKWIDSGWKSPLGLLLWMAAFLYPPVLPWIMSWIAVRFWLSERS